MSIVAYDGLQGSGKTYEVVSAVVVSAVRKQRRIITNIHGLNQEAIAEYCLSNFKEIVRPEIVVVRNTDIEAAEFFYYEREGPDHQTPLKAEGTFCKAGDLVIIDEAWRFWGTDCKIQPTHQIFFREHRHYTDQNGVSSDLVLISQSVNDFHPRLRRVIERTFRTRKLKELGWRRGYTVFQYEKTNMRSSALIGKEVKRYSDEIFALYKSYAAGQGAEAAVDKRESYFGYGKVWKLALFVVLCFGIGLWSLRNFFTPRADPAAVKSQDKGGKDAGKSGKDAKSDGVADSGSVGGKGTIAGASAPVAGSEERTWRLVGRVTRKESQLAIVKSSDGRYRWVRDPDFTMVGEELTVIIDGKPVTAYSGLVSEKSITGAKK